MKTEASQEPSVSPWCDIYHDTRWSITGEKLEELWVYFVISFMWWSCSHSHVAFITGFLCAAGVWYLCSLCCSCQLNPVSCLLFYSKDPPWISAPTPDERLFISELLTKFHRICFLFEGKIKISLSNAFFIASLQYSRVRCSVWLVLTLPEFESFVYVHVSAADRLTEGLGLQAVQGVQSVLQILIIMYSIWWTLWSI